jgi:hypothetical protein
VTAWLDRLTLSQRKLVFVGVAVVLIGLGAFAFRLSLQNQHASDAGATPASERAHSAHLERLPGIRDDAVPVEGQGAKDAALAVSDEEIAAAQAIAERFAAEYATRRWNEPLNARVARMAPLMSDELAAAFSADSGSAALEDERRALREVTTARPEFAYPQTVSRDELIFTVVVVQTLSNAHGTQQQRPSFQVVLAPREGGWRVVNVVA